MNLQAAVSWRPSLADFFNEQAVPTTQKPPPASLLNMTPQPAVLTVGPAPTSYFLTLLHPNPSSGST